ncbi:MAG: DMT family transporter [Verrucomicrobiae bacterium]|nr:DMT family transporter [Verrucomicrobiae bacterium]NNJ43897.1 DMT family transporter [Akkermansiaceae bacterium]
MNRPYLQLQLLILVFAFTSILGRLITLPAPLLVLWRTALAAVIMFIWLAISKRAPIAMNKGRVLRALGVGVILGLHWMTFFGSIQLANISICLAGLASTSFFTSLTEPLFEKRRLRLGELLLGVMVIPGLLMIAGASWNHAMGLGCALLSALFASIFPVINRKFALDGIAPQSLTLYEMIGAAVTCLVVSTAFGLPWASQLPTPTDGLWLAILVVVCTAWAFSFHIHLLRKFTAFTSNLVMNFEPVYGILLAAMIFREHKELTPLFYLGASLIIVANIIHALIHKNRQSAESGILSAE